ncbi:MAG: hypothetical protein ONB46_09295 [candidate division KSB1 bacterium]|nr:hypothetical protein [candidate division KSB1 bacterium]MDZ7365996.1 hypothetical protein [candidate division KSB1 bacterium]MDZ7404113.1 hypothetical protein [candidate division KSB1 bacterium]
MQAGSLRYGIFVGNLTASRQELQRLIPSFYNPYFFFGLTNALGIVAIYYSARLLENLEPLEWLSIPAVFLFANFIEYNFQRGPMHNHFNITFSIWDWLKGTLHRQIDAHA